MARLPLDSHKQSAWPGRASVRRGISPLPVAHPAQRRAALPNRSQPLRASWLHVQGSRVQRLAWLVGIGTGGMLVYWYVRSLQGEDVGPASIAGLSFAMAGTLLLLLVGAGYPLRKRWGARWPGRLHTFLAWHLVGGLLGLLLVWMHTTGTFAQSSGTYTFYGLLGVALSGGVGRLIDRVCPHLAARAALETLNAQGEERLEELAEAARTLARTAWPRLRPAFEPPRGRQWAAQEIRRQAEVVERALRRERFFLWLIRAWRHLHILCCLAATGCFIWHLEQAATALFQAF